MSGSATENSILLSVLKRLNKISINQSIMDGWLTEFGDTLYMIGNLFFSFFCLFS